MNEGHAPLVRVTRSGVTDMVHRGSAAAVDRDGNRLLVVGDEQSRAYIRSAAKPIQAILVVTSGAADAFGLDDADLAIISGSHRGGDAQVAQVRSILAKCELGEDHLQSGTGIADNCSGKHAGMLAVCKHRGYPLDTYVDREHPHQKAIVEVIATVCGIDAPAIHVGIDGCSAPIHYLPVYHMALGYARLSDPDNCFDEGTAAAVGRITRAMAAHPGGHTGEPAYGEVLGRRVQLLTKGGGSGVYCAGVVGRGIGFAMKVEDGAMTALKPVFAEVMRRLDVLTDAEAQAFRERFWPTIANRRKQVVGDVELLI